MDPIDCQTVRCINSFFHKWNSAFLAMNKMSSQFNITGKNSFPKQKNFQFFSKSHYSSLLAWIKWVPNSIIQAKNPSLKKFSIFSIHSSQHPSPVHLIGSQFNITGKNSFPKQKNFQFFPNPLTSSPPSSRSFWWVPNSTIQTKIPSLNKKFSIFSAHSSRNSQQKWFPNSTFITGKNSFPKQKILNFFSFLTLPPQSLDRIFRRSPETQKGGNLCT